MTAEPCPGCGAVLEPVDGPVHRYLGASSACWTVYSSILGGSPPLPPSPMAASMVDAYCVQHPGVDSPQSRQSVAVHAIALHAALGHGATPGSLIAARVDAVEAGRRGAVSYPWRDDWPVDWGVTIHDVIAGVATVEDWITAVYAQVTNRWSSELETWWSVIGN